MKQYAANNFNNETTFSKTEKNNVIKMLFILPLTSTYCNECKTNGVI
jgi:hypothetical protein